MSMSSVRPTQPWRGAAARAGRRGDDHVVGGTVAQHRGGLAAVVVRFSRSRKRYERQGILVEEAALEQAETQCLADGDARARRRERDRQRRTDQDTLFEARLAEAVGRLFPGCPPERAAAIASFAAVRGSGRVGRSAAGRALDEQAVTLAVVASVRHQDTDEALAAAATPLRQVQMFTEWVGAGRKLTQTGRITLADARELAGPVQGRVQVIDDLVGVAGKAVQGVHVAALPARQQQGGQVVGAAILGMQLPTTLISRRKRLRLGCGRLPEGEAPRPSTLHRLDGPGVFD
jgi:hypothetical protein